VPAVVACERRYVTTEFEARARPDGSRVIAGYAAKFDRKSQNLGGFVERIRAGAFAHTIGEADIRALFNHDPNLVLGRNRAGTLRLHEDEVGLAYEIDLPRTTAAADLFESMQRGDVNQSSFGFKVIDDEWGLDEDDFPVRTLVEVKLYDVSPVTFPAYLDTEANVVRAALGSLARSRDLSLDDLVAVAGRGELRSLLALAAPARPGAAPSSLLRRRADVLGRRVAPLP
jgi:HK97 family phage prohead protease